MITAYAEFVGSHPGNVVLSLAANDPASPLLTGRVVTFQVMSKVSSQTWASAGLLTTSLISLVGVGGIAPLALPLPLALPSSQYRVRARAEPSGYTPATAWSAWVEVAYDTAPPSTPAQITGRVVPYAQVLKGLATRRGICGELTECQAAEAAEYLTSAYRYCLEYWPWPEAMLSMEVPVSDGLVTWGALLWADYFQFWTADPDGPGATAYMLPVRAQDALGVRLDTPLTAVWAKFTPRPPVFTSAPVEADLLYVAGSVVFHPASGDVFECVAAEGALGSALADPTKWQPRRILWLLADPVKLLALADWLGNSEHERAQAEDLRQQTAAKLNEISTRVLRSLP